MRAFEELYIRVRSEEQRLYTDDQVASLPEIDPSHIYANEWKLRKSSTSKLIKYLEAKKSMLHILEIGCGNGWLSSKLADLSGATVCGWDVNTIELQQAKSIFKSKQNLSFEEKSVLETKDLADEFDIVIFAASIQYFSDFNRLINKALTLLKLNGEIHILDSHFYSSTEIKAAKERTMLYFEEMKCPEMADYYFHHDVKSLRNFRHKILYNPHNFWNKVFGWKNPFYWVRITK